MTEAGEIRVCPNCGTQAGGGARFCRTCGAALDAAPRVARAAASSPPPPPRPEAFAPSAEPALFARPRRRATAPPTGLIVGAVAAVLLTGAGFLWIRSRPPEPLGGGVVAPPPTLRIPSIVAEPAQPPQGPSSAQASVEPLESHVMLTGPDAVEIDVMYMPSSRALHVSGHNIAPLTGREYRLWVFYDERTSEMVGVVPALNDVTLPLRPDTAALVEQGVSLLVTADPVGAGVMNGPVGQTIAFGNLLPLRRHR